MDKHDDGRGNLYEQVLEYAKREMDEATSKMSEIKQSLQLLEARVEAAKAVYQAVASRLNLEDEADGVTVDISFPDLPDQAPEPPPEAGASSEETTSTADETSPRSERPDTTESDAAPSSDEVPTKSDVRLKESDLDVIRKHLAAKVEADAGNDEAESPKAAEDGGSSRDEDDSFSMQLIRDHLEQKAREEENSGREAPASHEDEDDDEADAESVPSSGGNSGGLSEADRELIGAYLRSKQN